MKTLLKKKAALKVFTFCIMLLTGFSLSAQNIYFSEDFSNPIASDSIADWQNINDGGTTGQTWMFDNPGNRTLVGADFDTSFAILDSDFYGSGNNQDASLISPSIDLSTSTSAEVFLTFSESYRHVSSSGSLDYSTDGGVTWNNLVTRTSSTGYPDPITASFDVTSLKGESDVRFRWKYVGSWGWWWAIDNVMLVGTNCLTPSNFTATKTGQTDVTFDWDTVPGADFYVLVYENTSSGDLDTILNITDNFYALSGLDSNVVYNAFVAAICGLELGSPAQTSFETFGPGADCSNPIMITSLPYTTTDNTENYFDVYSGSPGSSGCGTTSAYLNGDDVVYAYTADFTGNIDITMSPVGSWSGIFIYADCADIGTACLDGVASSTTADRIIDFFPVDSGDTYYIVISTWAAPQTVGYTLTIEPSPTCFEPEDITITELSFDYVSGSWTEVGPATEWQIEGGPQGFPLGLGDRFNVFGTPEFSVDGLDPNTDYEFYIRSVCAVGDTSDWLGPIGFRTICTPFAAPYLETFDDNIWVSGTGANNINSEIDSCWFRTPSENNVFAWGTRTGTTGSINTGPSGDNTTGSGNYIFTEAGNGSEGDLADFISPPIDLTSLTLPELRFYYHMYGNHIDTFSVAINNGSGWDIVQTLVGEQQTSSSAPYIPSQIILDNYVGDTIQVRFRVRKGSSFNGDVAIDDFEIREAPACITPDNIAVINLSTNSATAVWSPVTGAVNYDVALLDAGETFNDSATFTAITDTFFNLTALDFLADYDVYVRVICATDTSDWNFTPVTFSTICTTPLSGTYTINAFGNGDFISFTEAVEELVNCGVSGPVVINVDSATYNEQIIIPAIPGASSTNTITFTSANPEESIISYEDQVSADRYVIQLDGTSHLTIDNLGIHALSSDFGWGIHLTNNADSINLTNNIILLDKTNTLVSNVGGIIASNSNTLATSNGENANNLLIEGNTIIGGYHNIRLNGSSLAQSQGIVIRDNILQDAHAYGIYTDQLAAHLIFGNEVTRPTRTVSAIYYGIRVSNSSQFEINSNKIYDIYEEAPSTTFYGIYINASSAIASNPNLIANNLIYNIDNPSSISYVIRHLASDFTNIYHNTISLVDDNKTSANYLYYHSTAADNIEVKNNIFEAINAGTGTIRALWFAQATTGFISDNNVFNIEGSGSEITLGRLGLTNYADLSSWQTASTQDGNSVEEDPSFANAANGIFIPTNPAIDGIGDPAVTSIVPLDIDGETRDVNPDPGAYEFTPPDNDIALETILAPLPDQCYTSTEIAQVLVSNQGLQDLNFADDSLEITLIVDGILPQTFNTVINTGTLVVGDTLSIEITSVLDMSLEGLYEFTFIANLQDDGNPFNDTLTLSINRSPGVIVTNNTEVCFGEEASLVLTDFSGPVQWQSFDGTSWIDLSGETQAELELVMNVDSLLVRAEVCGNLFTDSVLLRGIIVDAPVIADVSRCGPGMVTFIATDNIEDGVRWFADSLGQNFLAEGDSFSVFINVDSTFYAQSFFGDPAEQAGKPEPTSTLNTSGANWGLVFDIVNQDVVIESVDIYSVGTGGTITVELQDASGNTIEALGSFTYPAGTTANPEIVTLPLDVAVPVGNDYRLIATSVTGGNLIRESSGNVFPYTSQSGNVVVTSGYISGVSQTYYWFYNWQVGSSCDSDIVPVQATLGQSDNDIAVNSIISPLPNTCYTSTETAEVLVTNAGVLDLDFSIDNLEIELIVTGAIPQTFTGIVTSGTLNVGDSLVVEVTDLLDLSAEGTYELSFRTTLPGDCNDFNDTISQTISVLSGEIVVNNTEVCIDADETLELVNSQGPIQWQILDGSTWVDVPGENNAIFDFTANTDSTFIRAMSCDFPSDTVLIEGIFVDAPVVADVTRCGPGDVTLIATANTFDGVRWYSDSLGNNIVGDGDSITIAVTNDTVFYAASSFGGGSGDFVGPADNTIGTGGNTTSTTFAMRFDVFADLTIETVDIYFASSGSSYTIELSDASGNVLDTYSGVSNVPTTGPDVVPVAFDVSPGTGYEIRFSQAASAYRNITGAVFPYEIPGVISITDNTFQVGQDGYWYYFYNWQISAGCESALTPVTVNVTEADTLDAPTDFAVCAGDEPQLVVSSANPDYVYTWAPSDVLSSTSGDTVTFTATSGQHVITVSASDAFGCNAPSKSFTIDVLQEPVVSLEASESIVCAGDEITLTAEGFISIAFDTLLFENFNAATALPTGWSQTSFFGTAVQTCDGGNSFRSNLWSSNPSTSLTTLSLGAPTGDLQVSFDYKVVDFSAATVPTTGNWGTLDVQYTIDNGATWNTFTTIDQNNHVESATCSTVTAIIDGADIVGASDISIRFSATWISGDYYLYIDNVLIEEEISAPFTLNWLDPSSVNNPDSLITSANPTMQTTYGFFIEDALGAGCMSDTAFVTVDVNELPIVDLGADQDICVGESVMLDAGNEDLNILWSTGDTTSMITATHDVTYTVVVTDTIGCSGTDTVTINSIPVPVTGVSALTEVCENESFVLTATPGLATYNWTGDITSTDQELSFDAGDLAPGIYEFVIEVVNVEGCNGIDSGVIEIFDVPVVDLGPDTLICLDESLVLDAGIEGVSYEWTGQQLSSNKTITVDGEVLGLGTFTYFLTITTSDGCQSSDQINVQIDQCIGIAGVEDNRYGINSYPNPTSDKVYLEVSNLDSEELYYYVHDALGRSISDLSGRIVNSVTEIDLSELAKGVYFIKVIENNTSVYYDKVILK